MTGSDIGRDDYSTLVGGWFELAEARQKGPDWMAGEAGVHASQIGRYRKKLDESVPIALNSKTVSAVKESVRRLKNEPLMDQYSRGVARAVDSVLVAMEGLLDYAPNIRIVRSPSDGPSAHASVADAETASAEGTLVKKEGHRKRRE